MRSLGQTQRSRRLAHLRDRRAAVAIASTVPIGSLPPVGEVPPRMIAQVVRQSRLGDPEAAFQPEEIDTPAPRAGEVLIAVMAAGINFNNVWAARGVPID